MSNYSAAEIGTRIGKTERWVKRNAHRLPHHRFGRTYTFTEEDLAEIQRMHAHRPAQPASPLTGLADLQPAGRGRATPARA